MLANVILYVCICLVIQMGQYQGIAVLFCLLQCSKCSCVYDVYSGCCYEIYVRAVMREEARKQAGASGASA